MLQRFYRTSFVWDGFAAEILFEIFTLLLCPSIADQSNKVNHDKKFANKYFVRYAPATFNTINRKDKLILS